MSTDRKMLEECARIYRSLVRADRLAQEWLGEAALIPDTTDDEDEAVKRTLARCAVALQAVLDLPDPESDAQLWLPED